MRAEKEERESRVHRAVDQAAGFLDRMAWPIFGDIPRDSGAPEPTPADRPVCPFCRHRMCDHWIEVSSDEHRHYLHCPDDSSRVLMEI